MSRDSIHSGSSKWRWGLVAWIGLVLGGCAGGPAIEYEGGPVFPPHRLQPVSLVVTDALEPVEMGPIHRAMAGRFDSPARRHQLLGCAWRDGAPKLIQLTVPGTELACYPFGRNPLPPSANWVDVETDSTGLASLTLVETLAVDQARHRGWSHLVVPQALVYSVTEADSTQLNLRAHVAIIDVLERIIVWQGLVDGEETDSDELRDAARGKPPITACEQATYAWLLTLLNTLDRIMIEPDDGLEDLSLQCHEPDPVFPGND